MKDPEFYENILGLRTPWKVEAVKLDTQSKSVEVKVKYLEGTLWASEAGERLPVHDHVERCWRHLDTCGFETRLICRVPRVRTPEGKVETVPVPARPPTGLPIPLRLLGGLGRAAALRCSTNGLHFEVLLACRSVSAAAELLSLSWDELQTIMERAVKRGLLGRELAGLRHVGMDREELWQGPELCVAIDRSGSGAGARE